VGPRVGVGDLLTDGGKRACRIPPFCTKGGRGKRVNPHGCGAKKAQREGYTNNIVGLGGVAKNTSGGG